MASGDSAAERAAAKLAVAAEHRRRAERAERAAADWAHGAEGESALAAALATLAADGYHRLDDRRLPGSTANVDHLLLGSAGAFVIDAKNWTGKLQIDGKSLRQNDRRRDDHLERVRVQAVDVSTIIEEILGHRRVEVRPVICFVGEAGLPARAVLDRVHLFNGGELVPFIRGLEAKLDQATADEVMRGLLARLPPRTAPVPKSEPAAPLERPSELVLFLRPWSRHGQRRLYVKADDGSDVGHLDLVTGQVQSPDAWRAVMAQLLPHYLSDTASGSQNEMLSGEARGVFRRFVDAMRRRPDPPPGHAILVGYHWKNFGKEHLYVNRLTPDGSKVEVGSFDLNKRAVRTAGPGARVIVEYCGNQFLTTATR